MNKHDLEYIQKIEDDELDQLLFDQRYERKLLKSPKGKALINAYIKLIEAEIAHRDYIFYHTDGE